MNILTTMREFLFVRPELVLTQRLENPQYLPSVKSTFTKIEEYATWLERQSFQLEADSIIASTIGIKSRVERIRQAQLLLQNEINSINSTYDTAKQVA